MSRHLQIFGSIIREERQKRGLSQEYLAEMAEVSRAYLGEIERGEANLSFTVLIKLSEALNMTLTELARCYELRISS
jgi:transcriptional regulator with XRE-family HTH domain